jgi:TolA-binding protein
MEIVHKDGKFWTPEGTEITRLTTEMLGEDGFDLKGLSDEQTKYVTGKRMTKEMKAIEDKHVADMEKLKNSFEAQLAGSLSAQRREELETELKDVNGRLESLQTVEEKASALSQKNRELEERLNSMATVNDRQKQDLLTRSIRDDIDLAFRSDDIDFQPYSIDDFHRTMRGVAKEIPVLDENEQATGRTKLVYRMQVPTELSDGKVRMEDKDVDAPEAVKLLGETNRHWRRGSATTGSGDVSSYNTSGGTRRVSPADVGGLSQAEFEKLYADKAFGEMI